MQVHMAYFCVVEVILLKIIARKIHIGSKLKKLEKKISHVKMHFNYLFIYLFDTSMPNPFVCHGRVSMYIRSTKGLSWDINMEDGYESQEG
jgi:hypothetical protein